MTWPPRLYLSPVTGFRGVAMTLGLAAILENTVIAPGRVRVYFRSKR